MLIHLEVIKMRVFKEWLMLILILYVMAVWPIDLLSWVLDNCRDDQPPCEIMTNLHNITFHMLKGWLSK